jgi:hypothetical protein
MTGGGKLECSCVEQMELAALFSADVIGPLANSLGARILLVMHHLKVIIDVFTCTPKHTLQIVSTMESRTYETRLCLSSSAIRHKYVEFRNYFYSC